MALNDVRFNRNQTGLGQALPGSDHISGFVFYADTYPSGFNASNKIKKIFSLADAVNLGIDADYSDETKATLGNVAITVKGAAGDVDSIFFSGVLLGQVTVPAGAYTDASAEAVAIRAAINANTQYHGFTSAGSTVNVTIVPPTGWGKASNGTNITFTSVAAIGGAGTATATVTQLSLGVGSLYLTFYYKISEFYRINPQGVAYVGVFPVPVSFDGSELTTMQSFANGEIRNFLVHLNAAAAGTAFASSQVTAMQTICTALQTAHKPLSGIFEADFTSATLATLSNLSTLTGKNVSVPIHCEGDFNEAAYSRTAGYSVGDKVTWGAGCYQCLTSCLGIDVWNTVYWARRRDNVKAIVGFSVSGSGNLLGAISLAKVHECVAWPQKFNIVTNTEMDNVGFVTGDLLRNQTDALLSTLNDYHYIFLRKITGLTGSFFNDSWTAIVGTNDYCYIEKNRTMDKCERNVRAAVIPLLASPLYVNADGTLSQQTIAVFENAANIPILQMEIDGELSNHKVTIDPTQNVISSSKLVMSLVNIPVGVARVIEINTGFTTKIQ